MCVCVSACMCVRACVCSVCLCLCMCVCVCVLHLFCFIFILASWWWSWCCTHFTCALCLNVCALDTVWECKGTEWPSKTPTTNATHAGFPGSPKHYVEEQTVVLVSSFKVQNTAQTCYFSSRRAVCAGQHQPHQSTVSTAGFPAGGSRGSRSYSYCSCGA